MTPTPIELYRRARAQYPAPIDIEKRVARYQALMQQFGYASEKEAPCDASSQS